MPGRRAQGTRDTLEPASEPPTIADIVDALMLLDEPMLNSRYHGLLLRLTSEAARDRLEPLPRIIAKSLQLSRRGSYAWMRTGEEPSSSSLGSRAERVLMEAFLSMSEQQIHLISFLARSAPTAEVREPFEQMAQLHRDVSEALRTVLKERILQDAPPAKHPPSHFRGVQEEAESGDLRGQIEGAIRDATSKGQAIRRVVLSHTGLRHLRDQGCFADGDTTLSGLPVAVDLAWDVPAFALQSFDLVPLDEIMAANAEGNAEGRGQA